MGNLRNKLIECDLEYGFLIRQYCSEDESKNYRQLLKSKQPLPDGVYGGKSDNGSYIFFRIKEEGYTEQEKEKYLFYKQLAYLRTIKNCMIIFTVLAVLSLIGWMFLYLM